MEQPLLTKANTWTAPQKVLAVLLVLNLLIGLSTLITAAVVGVRIYDVTSPESLCKTATTCLGKTNFGISDALVAAMDPYAWTRIFKDIAQLAKQLKTVDWTLETSQSCNFLVYCYQLSTSEDCAQLKDAQGGVCDWISGQCQSRAGQTQQTAKLTSSQIVGCQALYTYSDCAYAVPIPPAGNCRWDSTQYRCLDDNTANPGRVLKTCHEDVKVDNRTQQDIRNAIDRIQSVAQTYRTNATGTGVTSSIDIPEYIARQLEANWTLTASACVSLSSALLGTNVSAFACPDTIPECDSYAMWQVSLSAVRILCDKVQRAHLIVV